jgi:transposase
LQAKYRCVITNLATNNVYQMLEFRTQDHLKPFFKNLPDRERVEWVCTDMWRPFKRSFSQYLPNARLVIDKFHVVKMASEALEEERKKYQATLSKDERLHVKKSIRWLTLKAPRQPLNAAEQKALEAVRQTIPALGEAYDFKEAFFRIYDDPTKHQRCMPLRLGKTRSQKANWKNFTALQRPCITTTRTSLPTGILPAESPMPTQNA